MKRLRTVLVLTALGGLAGVLLGVTAHYTKPYIESNRKLAAEADWQELRESAEALIREFREQPTKATCKLQGAYESHTTHGYGGEMKVLVAFVNNQIVGVRVPSHRETPGYSDVLDPTDWIGRFAVEELAEIDTVSRATITTRAVLNAVTQLSAQQVRRQDDCLL